MSHVIGLDQSRPYKRHGKLFYKPYRNYFTGENQYLTYLCGPVRLVKRTEQDGPFGKYVTYELTRRGLDFLERRLNMKIYDMS